MKNVRNINERKKIAFEQERLWLILIELHTIVMSREYICWNEIFSHAIVLNTSSIARIFYIETIWNI